MAIFKCKMCGGTLEIQENQTVIECDFCGTTQTVPKLTSDRISNLYARANHYRCNNEFDRAMEIYEQILLEDNNDSEAYWSIVLCKYGIVYVEDPATHKRIPTMNRTQMVSILADPDYQNALQYADAIQRKVYEEEAKTIERIQKGILEISSREEKFDVFICYKEKDENGQRTRDSVIAQEIYYGLKEEGFKVFFARITLEDKLGTAYEPYIFSALNSSKVMIVLGTKPEYFEAVWVKNEWSRFLSQIKNGERKLLIPAYRGMDPYLLPAEFSHLQAQNMENIGFLQDLIRGVTKVVNASKPKQQEQQVYQTVGQSTSSNPTVRNYLKRAKMFLQDGDFENALEYCEKALDLDPENSDAYLYKLLYDLRINDEKDLGYCGGDFSDNLNFKKAYNFGSAERKRQLDNYLHAVREELAEEDRLNRTRKRQNLALRIRKTAMMVVVNKHNNEVKYYENQIKYIQEQLSSQEKKLNDLELDLSIEKNKLTYAKKYKISILINIVINIVGFIIYMNGLANDVFGTQCLGFILMSIGYVLIEKKAHLGKGLVHTIVLLFVNAFANIPGFILIIRALISFIRYSKKEINNNVSSLTYQIDEVKTNIRELRQKNEKVRREYKAIK